MKQLKAHTGLTALEPGARYHLGYYDIDFPDGNLVFQVFAQPCPKPDCPCDDFQLDFEAADTRMAVWYTGHREWLDYQHRPMDEEVRQVFTIVEKTEMFQERYQHLAYLRRRQVLERAGRDLAPFQILIPSHLAPDDGRSLGQVAIPHKGQELAYHWEIQFCGDQECYCQNLFINLHHKAQEWSFILDSKDQWSPANEHIPASMVSKVSQRFKKLKKFTDLIAVFRSERRLENYFRFVTRYSSPAGTS